jgi:hypothetical protein
MQLEKRELFQIVGEWVRKRLGWVGVPYLVSTLDPCHGESMARGDPL